MMNDSYIGGKRLRKPGIEPEIYVCPPKGLFGGDMDAWQIFYDDNGEIYTHSAEEPLEQYKVPELAKKKIARPKITKPYAQAVKAAHEKKLSPEKKIERFRANRAGEQKRIRKDPKLAYKLLIDDLNEIGVKGEEIRNWYEKGEVSEDDIDLFYRFGSRKGIVSRIREKFSKKKQKPGKKEPEAEPKAEETKAGYKPAMEPAPEPAPEKRPPKGERTPKDNWFRKNREICAGIAGAAVLAGYIAYKSLLPSYEMPEPGTKYLIEKVVLDGGRDILTNDETTGWYLLKVKRIDLGKDSVAIEPSGKKYKIDSATEQVSAKDVPYKLIILGHNKPLKELRIGGTNLDDGKIIEVKNKFIDDYMDNKDGIRKFVYPMDRVEIDNLNFWKVVNPIIPEEIKIALEP